MLRMAVALWLIWVSCAAAACRQALVLGLDVSGSVDAREYRLQLDGLAAALQHPDVRQALLAMPSAPVSLAVFEWSGPRDQRVLVGWTVIRDGAGIDRISAQLAATNRREATPSTALGQAMVYGAAMLNRQPDCWARTLDVSGDGKSNIGLRPAHVKQTLVPTGITINALVVGADNPTLGDTRQADIAELSSYFRANVILGPDAFIETALGFETFEQTMVRKLRRELKTLAVSRKGP